MLNLARSGLMFNGENPSADPVTQGVIGFARACRRRGFKPPPAPKQIACHQSNHRPEGEPPTRHRESRTAKEAPSPRWNWAAANACNTLARCEHRAWHAKLSCRLRQVVTKARRLPGHAAATATLLLPLKQVSKYLYPTNFVGSIARIQSPHDHVFTPHTA